MSQKRDNLAPRYEPGKQYMLDGELINNLIRAIQKNKPIAGDNMEFEEMHDGIILHAQAGGGGATPAVGAFCQVTQNNGSYILNGGTVTGGAANITVPPINLGAGVDGTHVWLSCSFEAYVEDEMLLGGGTLTGVIVGSGLNLQNNQMPTATSPNGRIVVSLGSWYRGVFSPSSCGDISIGHCPGQLTVNRR